MATFKFYLITTYQLSSFDFIYSCRILDCCIQNKRGNYFPFSVFKRFSKKESKARTSFFITSCTMLNFLIR